MVIFHSYVSLPEGTLSGELPSFSAGWIRSPWKIAGIHVSSRETRPKKNPQNCGIHPTIPSGYVKIAIEAKAIEIVDLPMKNDDFP
jgi:hypothetical protein